MDIVEVKKMYMQRNFMIFFIRKNVELLRISHLQTSFL